MDDLIFRKSIRRSEKYGHISSSNREILEEKGIRKLLIIKKKWLDLILSGKKVWEIRSKNTRIRGKIGLIESNSSNIIGECEITDSKEISFDTYQNSTSKHCINDTTSKPYNRIYAWEIRNAKRFEKPIPYIHPLGAVIWVDLKNLSSI